MSGKIVEPEMVERIRQAVKDSGIALLELGQKTGVDHGRLSRFLRGERTITLPAAARICEVLGLELVRSGRPPKAMPAPPPAEDLERPAKRPRRRPKRS